MFKKKDKIKSQAIYKVFVLPIVHPAYYKVACLRLEDKSIIHAVYDGFDWLLVDALTLRPSPTGLLRMKDVDQITLLLNLGEFLDDHMMSKATYQIIGEERLIVLDEGRV